MTNPINILQGSLPRYTDEKCQCGKEWTRYRKGMLDCEHQDCPKCEEKKLAKQAEDYNKSLAKPYTEPLQAELNKGHAECLALRNALKEAFYAMQHAQHIAHFPEESLLVKAISSSARVLAGHDFGKKALQEFNDYKDTVVKACRATAYGPYTESRFNDVHQFLRETLDKYRKTE